uniref:Uncharacterized protein n=1 Tax=Parastrongyloides trichosuri TaxID=131310 RepID=A0A0N5A6S0_PARTI
MVGVIVCITVMCVQHSVSTNIETIATQSMIAMNNWNDSEVVLCNGLLLPASAIISFINYMLQTFTFVHNIDQRKLLIFGLSVFLIHHSLNYPWNFYPDTLNYIPLTKNGSKYSTVKFGSCSKKYVWCNNVHRFPTIIYCITMILCLGFDFPLTSPPNNILYPDILRLRRQNFHAKNI